MINQHEYEERLLGAAVGNYTTKTAKALAMLTDACFCSASTRHTFKAIQSIADSGRPVDLVTVDEVLRLAVNRGDVPLGCDFSWLIEITKNGVSDANAEAYAKIIRANHAMASAVAKLDEVKANILENQNPVMAMQSARDALMAMDFGVGKRKPRQADELVDEYLAHRMAVFDGTASDGLRLTIDGMSHAFGTIGHSDFIVVAGRPGSG
jgi:replicative DNA helicase